VVLGLGSTVGTGVFVSIGLAAGVAGPAVLLAIILAALVATCSALSSAQLAASHPVSGGTYEYGYRYLTPTLGATAGWLFLAAKTASAATAALGFAGYLITTTGVGTQEWTVPLALVGVALFTTVVASGIRTSTAATGVTVTLALGALLLFMLAGIPSAAAGAPANLTPLLPDGSRVPALLHAAALMFVAYTGYGRIATLGEEVRDPGRTIPRAIVITLVVSLVVYLGVAAVAVGTVGSEALDEATQATKAPLEETARLFGFGAAAPVVALGALAAMLGVLLNLILGLSRVVLAMARRRDLPGALASVSDDKRGPVRAVLVTGIAVSALVLTGNIKLTWSFAAVTVLVYYTITNLAALRLPAAQRRYPAWIAAAGIVGCLGVGFWVDWTAWAAAAGLITLVLTARAVAQRNGTAGSRF
jgi:APA family basic amino acid/polyamine antiporter